MTPTLEVMKDASIRRITGPTILLGSGTYFDFEAPEESEITIEDIAYGLAYACRFAGQCYSRILNRRVFYSVAEHCVRMSMAAAPALRFQALMHELGEPVCGDMTGPLKSLCPDYKRIEKNCEAAIARRFDVSISDPAEIKSLDLRMLATEKRDLMRSGSDKWDYTRGAEPFEFEIVPWDHEAAAVEFLRQYHELRPAR